MWTVDCIYDHTEVDKVKKLLLEVPNICVLFLQILFFRTWPKEQSAFYCKRATKSLKGWPEQLVLHMCSAIRSNLAPWSHVLGMCSFSEVPCASKRSFSTCRKWRGLAVLPVFQMGDQGGLIDPKSTVFPFIGRNVWSGCFEVCLLRFDRRHTVWGDTTTWDNLNNKLYSV